ncbi:hypothetical protein QJR26_03635 [Clostridium baratii]
MGITYAKTVKGIIKEIIELNTDDEISNFINELSSHELNGDVIEYSSILEYLKKIDGETRTKLNNSCSKIKELIKDEEESKGKNILYKILEYIALEVPRINEYEKMNNTIESFSKSTRRQRTQALEYDKKLASAQGKLDKVQSEFISILSIFSAVVIAFFGGINLLGGALASINDTNKYKLIVIILLIGMIMFNVIFLLLYTISKLIEKPISVNKKRVQCLGCYKKNGFRCFVNRYPVPVYYNLLTFYGIIMVSIMYYLDEYNFITHAFKISISNMHKISIIYIFSVLGAILLGCLSMYVFYKLTMCKQNKINKRNVKGVDGIFEKDILSEEDTTNFTL